MGVKEGLQVDLRDAIRSRDSDRVSVIRLLRNSIQYLEKSQGKPLNDDDVIMVVARQANQCRESIEAFLAGNRQDLADKEQLELAILETYLPTQMTRDQLIELAHQSITEVGATGLNEKGKVMARLMPQIRGKADGALANELVMAILSGSL